MYKFEGISIPQEKRKEINEKILYMINNNSTDQFGITKENIFNMYSGEGGLHGLEFKDYNSFHDYTEAKKEIENGQFFTPSNVCEFIVDCLQPSNNDFIIDLTSGMGNFFNYLPNQLNVYGNELDNKAYKVASYLYPESSITNSDIRYFNTDIKFDIVLGNPPFNLKWKVENNEYISQLYYCMKSYEVLKNGGFMALIVPKSFLNDEFSDGGMIKEINSMFNFVCQFELPSNLFANLGVSKFETKMMIFQKKSEHIQDKEYKTDISMTDISKASSELIHNTYIKPLQNQLEAVRTQIKLENLHSDDQEKEYQYTVNKLLFDIKRNPKINKYYGKCVQYSERLYTQVKPEGMEPDEWNKKKVTKNKVLSYLKSTLKKQHSKPQLDKIELVKTRYGLKLKAYSNKTKVLLNKSREVKEISFVDLIINNEYSIFNSRYNSNKSNTLALLANKKKNEYREQNQSFEDVKPTQQIKSFLDELEIKNNFEGSIIKLNDIQKEDTAKLLMKPYVYLQWGTGAGKSISAIAQMEYRLHHNNIRNIFLVAPAIAINNNWQDILEAYGMDYVRINKLDDINNIKHGQIVIMTFAMLIKYEKQLKKYIKKQSQKVMFVLDEADNISNPSSKRTKVTLNVFRRVKYKLLMSGTMTRNNIPESFTAFELLYNNSVNMISKNQFMYVEDKRSKEIKETLNNYYMKPFPPYKKGFTHFKRTFSPEKVTVFGVGKQNQDIYNADYLTEMINNTIITRTFEEVSGKDIYKIIQDTTCFNSSEHELYKIVVKEFYRLTYMYGSTGNSRKDALLRIIQQLNSLLKACVTPNEFKEYNHLQKPSKTIKTLKMLNKWQNEIVVIGCTHIKTVELYTSYIKNEFPGRKVFVITGNKTSLNKRKEIIEQLKVSGNGILICTQQSLSSSMNIDFVNKILMIELQWNFASMHQFFARFVRYTSTEQKEIHFLTIENSIESNLLKLIMSKEKLNNFMKNDSIDEQEILDKFGIDFDILSMLMTKEKDEEGKSYISWGEQLVI